MSDEGLREELERLRKENERLRARSEKGISLKAGTDLGAAVELVRAASRTASLNVETNLPQVSPGEAGRLRLRRESPALRFPDKERMRLTPFPEHRTLVAERWDGDDETLIAMNFSDRSVEVQTTPRTGTWDRVLDSAEERWGGPGTRTPAELIAASEVRFSLAPHSVAVYALREEPVTNR